MRKNGGQGIIVRGVRSQRGYPMALISDYQVEHYELLSQLILNYNAALARMADRGIVAVGERAAYIRSQLGDLTYDDEKIVYDSAGWNGSAFIDGGKRAHLPQGGNAGHAAFSGACDRFRTSGTLDGWMENVAQPLAGQMVAEFLLGAMIAGVLVGFTGQTINPGFMIVGRAEDGKSLMLAIAASLCGAPTANNLGDSYGLSFTATTNGIEDEMQNYPDMTMIWDDSALFDFGMNAKQRGRAFVECIMRLAQGREKIRKRERARHFHFCYLTSSNDDLSEIIQDAPSTKVIEAVSSRLSTVNLRDRPEGVLDFLPPAFSEKADFLGSLLAAAEKHHGVALPHLLEQLVDVVARDPEGFVARLRGHIADFRQEATRGAPQKASRRVLDAFGLVYAASRLGQRYDALPGSFSPLRSALTAYRIHVGGSLPAPRPVEIVAALLDDPEVRRVRHGKRLDITREQFKRAKGFRVESSTKTELIMSPEAAERTFDNWGKVHKRDRDIRRIMVREESRPDTYRKIRAAARDRVICFRIPPDWPFLRR